MFIPVTLNHVFWLDTKATHRWHNHIETCCCSQNVSDIYTPAVYIRNKALSYKKIPWKSTNVPQISEPHQNSRRQKWHDASSIRIRRYRTKLRHRPWFVHRCLSPTIPETKYTAHTYIMLYNVQRKHAKPHVQRFPHNQALTFSRRNQKQRGSSLMTPQIMVYSG